MNDLWLLLCRYFGLSDGWWHSLQSHHDTQVARKSLGKRLHLFGGYRA